MISKRQDWGNELRKKYGNDVLSQLVVEKIADERAPFLDSPKAEEGGRVSSKIKREKRRVATIIDSLKHPAEVLLLQKIYSNMFYLFGVLSSDPQRINRLRVNKEIAEEDAIKLMQRDRGEGLQHGQQLSKTLQYADFFIRNNKVNINSLKKPVERFIHLLLGKKDITPTKHEFAMYIASSAARRSGCLSRQVGASIISKDGTIVSTGCNDVPKFGGGLYTTDDHCNDNRCFNYFDHSCQNNKYKNIIKRDIAQIIRKNSLVTGDKDNSKLSDDEINSISDKIANYPRIKNLLEFSRSVHAEMDAIISVAKEGKQSLKGTTLYTTTFPCHYCARHIIASGINKVYYIEPYDKSMAADLHSDAIEIEPAETATDFKKVVFLHFEGVSPKKYLELFCSGERKLEGRLIEEDLGEASPAIVHLLDTYLEYEAKVVEYVQLNLGGSGDDQGKRGGERGDGG